MYDTSPHPSFCAANKLSDESIQTSTWQKLRPPSHHPPTPPHQCLRQFNLSTPSPTSPSPTPTNPQTSWTLWSLSTPIPHLPLPVYRHHPSHLHLPPTAAHSADSTTPTADSTQSCVGPPSASRKRTKTTRAGSLNYSTEDVTALLDAVGEVEPLGANHWAVVAHTFGTW